MDKDIFQYLIRVYQASHKNTIELCKINIFYLHKISVFKVKIHPVWKNILKLHIQFMI